MAKNSVKTSVIEKLRQEYITDFLPLINKFMNLSFLEIASCWTTDYGDVILSEGDCDMYSFLRMINYDDLSQERESMPFFSFDFSTKWCNVEHRNEVKSLLGDSFEDCKEFFRFETDEIDDIKELIETLENVGSVMEKRTNEKRKIVRAVLDQIENMFVNDFDCDNGLECFLGWCADGEVFDNNAEENPELPNGKKCMPFAEKIAPYVDAISNEIKNFAECD